ncbi:GNAT family N-acetyltransferase [Aquicoccus sp. SCR17]|nr:GNAT family N-acetyltransferase [Carideicomes alvinocaridis]
MLLGRRKVRIETERLTLRAPVHSDYRDWSALRLQSEGFLTPWEPTWADDHLSRRAFTNRVYWAQRSINSGSAYPLFLIRREDEVLVGAITLDNIRRGPAQAGTLGYWVGLNHARQGYMRETIEAVVHYAYRQLDLSRIEAACLPENAASRALLEKCGFKYEGVAQSYLQINGRWRTHVLYASLRADRRGRAEGVAARAGG